MTRIIHKQRASMTDTLAAMRAAALGGKKDLPVRRLVEKITQGIAQGDYSSEVLAIYYWVCQNIRYLRDIDGVEYLQIPRRTLESKTGDCDDIATLLAAMLMAAGNPVRFAIASFKPVPVFSHVYVEVLTPHGPIVIDPVANRDTGKMLGQIRHRKTYPVSGGGGTVDAGIGSVVAPARHLSPDGNKVYSVFDYNRNEYTYFEGTPGTIPATGRYRPPSRRTSMGSSPEAIAAALPSGARKTGSGAEPKGILASTSRPAAGLRELIPPTTTLATAALGALVGIEVYKRWRRR